MGDIPNGTALNGIRVIDASTVLAGPLIAALLGDFGADVIKIEHPKGDPLREFGPSQGDKPIWWKVISRNKRCVTLDLKAAYSKQVFKKLVGTADVLIENFRTGTLESWGLGPDVLTAINPSLVVVSVTGFGQTGPYRRRPGFGTLAEAFSGFAHVTGEPDGPPTLPPIGLADGIAGLYGTFAAVFALYERDAVGSGKGQLIDLSLYEPMFAMLGAHATLYSELGEIPTRTGNRSRNSVPRNTYKTRDQRWVAIAATTPSTALRVMRLTGGEEFAADPRFATSEERIRHATAIDAVVAAWIAQHDLIEVIRTFEEVEAAIAPVNDIKQIVDDPQYRARHDIIAVPDCGSDSELMMPNSFPYLSRTPGKVRFAGPSKGFHNREIFIDEMNLSAEELRKLEHEGVIFAEPQRRQ